MKPSAVRADLSLSPIPASEVSARTSSGLSGAARVRRQTHAALTLVVLVDSVGTGTFVAGSAMFYARVIGVSVGQVGIGLSGAAVLGLVASLFWGTAIDRVGARAVLITLNVWRAVGYLVLTSVSGAASFFVVVAFLGLADRSVAAATQVLVAEVVGASDRVRTMAKVRSLRNIGFTIGALLATLAFGRDTAEAYRVLVLANAASFAVAAALLVRLPSVDHHTEPPSLPRVGRVRVVLRDRCYVAATALNAVLLLHMTLLTIGIPLWAVGHTNAPKTLVAPLFALNTALTVVLQVRASRRAASVPGASGALRRSGIALGVSCLLLATTGLLRPSGAALVLVMAVLALTVGELWQSAGGWGLSYALAPSDLRGAYLSVFNSGTTMQQIVGPALVAGLVVGTGTAGWLGLGVVFAATGLVAGTVPRWAGTVSQPTDV